MPNPDLDAPRHVRKFLTRRGGRNPFGAPMWRAILAQNSYVKCGGIFHEVPGGNLSIVTRGPHGEMLQNPVSRRCIGSGIMEVPRYPHEGWILERWFPASTWGTREWWESQKSEDGSPLLGAYPAEGGYYLIAGPWPKIAEISDLEQALDMYEHQQRARPVDLQAAISQKMRDEESDRARRMHELEADIKALHRQELQPILKSGSLAAQRFRQELGARVGDHTHQPIA